METTTAIPARTPIGVRPRGLTQRSATRYRPVPPLVPARAPRRFDLDDLLAATLLVLLAGGYLTALVPLLTGVPPAAGWPLA